MQDTKSIEFSIPGLETFNAHRSLAAEVLALTA